jgi:hypothetical protein
MTARQTMNAGLNWTMIVMIQINRNSSLWLTHHTSSDGFRLYHGPGNRLKRHWWRWIYRNWESIRGSRSGRTACMNELTPGSLCILTKIFISRQIIGHYGKVAFGNWLMNKGIAGNKQYLASDIKFNQMRVTSVRI